VTQPASVAPSDTLLSLVLSRTVDLVAARVEIDPIRVEEDATVRLVEQYADVNSTHGEALVEAVSRRVGSGIGAADVAAYVDLGDLAGEVDLSDLVGHIDLGDVAEHIDVSDVAEHIDLSELAREVIHNDVSDDAREVAQNIDVSDVASNIDLSELAGNIDLSDLAAEVEVDPAEVAEHIDLDDLASRAMAGLADIDERLAAVEKATGPLAAMDGALDLHRERLVALEERVAALAAPTAGDLVSVQIGPALPAAAPAAPSGDVLALVVDRTVEALLAALNAAAAEGRI
jgi:hypothetical protein